MVDLDPTPAAAETPLPEQRIDVLEDGPYHVHGSLPLQHVTIVETEWGEPVDTDEGEPLNTGRWYALCRCGNSQTKPFCDESHARVGFDGTETADRAPRDTRARQIRGRDITFSDDRTLCTHAGFCSNRRTDVWEMVRDTADPEVRAQIERMVGYCPSGRLAMEPPADPGEPGVLLERDGPIWVRGAVTLRAADGSTYEVRGRMALCRCGASRNKPFCDDSHSEVGFRED